jgi:uncharacterized protein involved in response to NO
MVALTVVHMLTVDPSVLPPRHPAVGLLSATAAILAAGRAVHWGTRHTLREPLLWVLHVGYAWIPLGLLAEAATVWGAPFVGTVATHALTTGAIGTMTLGMMARVTLGHTGRPLTATRGLHVAFVAITGAAVARAVAGAPTGSRVWLDVGGTLWAAAFVLFLVTLGPALFKPRADGRV